MATTYTNFVPPASGAFQFQPTLDGQVYTVIVTWSLFGRRFYVSIYQLDGTLVVSLPMIGSPSFRDISLTAGYFTSTLVFRQANQQFEVSP